MAGRERLPEWMPIVEGHMAGRDYPARYAEPELYEPIDLCDGTGRLHPTARGWARRPLVYANLSGSWLRKKKWNFLNWISPEFVFSVTLANIDYVAFCSVNFMDFETGESLSGMTLARPGAVAMPESVERTVQFRQGSTLYSNRNEGGDMVVRFQGTIRGRKIDADFIVRKPPGHESLSVVVPWSETRFQLNCKENTLPCEGTVLVGNRRYGMDPGNCHGVQDFGRGIWPYRSFWNWGVCSGVQEGRAIGVNVGAKWTTGTGANENALCIDGRLQKIMEDLVWEYDPKAPQSPWRVRSVHTDVIDMELRPVVMHRPGLNLGVVSSGGVCAFGFWSGRIRFGDEEIKIRDLVGWAEEFAHRW